LVARDTCKATTRLPQFAVKLGKMRMGFKKWRQSCVCCSSYRDLEFERLDKYQKKIKIYKKNNLKAARETHVDKLVEFLNYAQGTAIEHDLARFRSNK
jgi:hypothetical protein